MTIKLLLVEDNDHKRLRIVDFLRTLPRHAEVREVRSFQAACKAIEQDHFALVLLDISMPTFDRAGAESGGRFRAFAGREVARKLIRRKATTKILFITQYAAFSDRGLSYSFEELKELLAAECGTLFAGMVFYDGSQSAWKDEINAALKRME